MPYVTVKEIEDFTGFAYSDFKTAGTTMSEGQWQTMLDANIPNIEQMIHRHCNVTSFDPSTVLVEYHSGRGANNDELGSFNPGLYNYGIYTQGSAYLMSDVTFYLREACYALTKVEEDTSSKTTAPNWVTRTARTTGVAGDYESITKNEITSVAFHNNIPLAGMNNVRFTYNCGYGFNTPQFREIKLCALRMMKNFLLLKKKTQEVITIRASGIRDFSQMFDIMNESVILTESVKLILDKYRRWEIEGDIYL